MKIVFPEGPAPKPVLGTKLYTEGGQAIEHVTRVKMDLKAEQVLEAEITIEVDAVENLDAHPLLNLGSLEDAAARYGYTLVPIDTAGPAIDEHGLQRFMDCPPPPPVKRPRPDPPPPRPVSGWPPPPPTEYRQTFPSTWLVASCIVLTVCTVFVILAEILKAMP